MHLKAVISDSYQVIYQVKYTTDFLQPFLLNEHECSVRDAEVMTHTASQTDQNRRARESFYIQASSDIILLSITHFAHDSILIGIRI